MEKKMMNKQQKAIRTCDILIWVSFVLMLLVKISTMFIFVQIQEETGAEIQQIATTYEGNDLFKIAFTLGKMGVVLTMIILPATAMATYYFFRRKALQGKMEIDTLLFFVQFAFFSLIINICNDGAILISKLVEVI